VSRVGWFSVCFSFYRGFDSDDADDILRARIRTLGVEEHHFAVENSANTSLFS
jgi:hypothetical protein